MGKYDVNSVYMTKCNAEGQSLLGKKGIMLCSGRFVAVTGEFPLCRALSSHFCSLNIQEKKWI